MKNIVLTITLSLLLAGCSMLPATKHDAAATRAADSIASQQAITVEKIVDLTPGVPLPAQDQVTSQAVPPSYHAAVKVQASSSQAADSAVRSSSAWSVTLPIGTKLILAGIGMLLILLVLWVGARMLKQTAFGQGAALADDVLRRLIQSARQKAMLSDDAADKAAHAAQIAELEAERGKLAAK